MSESALESSALPHSWEAQPQTDGQTAFGSVDARCSLQLECGTNDARSSNGSLFETRTRTRKVPCPCPWWKRTVDLLGAAALLALLAPAMLGVAALIKCVSRGPV